MDILTLKRIFKRGIERIRRFFSFVGDRLHVEIALIKTLAEIEKQQEKRKNILEKIGERFVEIAEKPEQTIRYDPVLRELVEELKKIDVQISILKQEADEISRMESE